MRILIGDDHAVSRQRLSETLGEVFAKATVGKSKTAQETLELVRPSE